MDWLVDLYNVGLEDGPDPDLEWRIREWALVRHQSLNVDEIDDALRGMNVSRLSTKSMHFLVKINIPFWKFLNEWKPFVMRCKDEMLAREMKPYEITKLFDKIINHKYEFVGEFGD